MKRLILIIALFVSVRSSYALPTHFSSRTKRDSVLICQSKSAYAYHSHVCRGLGRCTHKVVKMSKEDAIKAGYKPCGFCYK